MLKFQLMMKMMMLMMITAAVATDLLSEPFSSAPQNFDLEHAIDICKWDVSCAGVTETAAGDNDTQVVFHSFLPSATESTFQATKAFTFHSGRIQDASILSSVNGTMDIDQAKEYCASHDECVAFMYRVYSRTQLVRPDEIVFVSRMNAFELSYDDEWRTYVANDLRKASNVNATNLVYDEDTFEYPFTSCCKHTEIPTIDAVKEADPLERIPCSISREEFQEKYESERKPVMLVGCEKDWPAKTRWTHEALIPRFDNSTKWRAQVTDEEELNPSASWRQVTDAITTGRGFYIFDQLDHPAGKEIEKDYTVPTPFQGSDLYGNLHDFPEDYGSKRWFCVGKRGTGTHPHIDPLGTDAWNTLLSGHKWWVIYPHTLEDPKGLECKSECSDKDLTLQHWYASIGLNAARSEYSLDMKPYHVLQKPGETIYVPYGRVHSVFNMDDTIAVTENFGSAYNLEEVWKTLVQDGTEEHWKHVYYQELDKEQRAFVRNTKYWPPPSPQEEE